MGRCSNINASFYTVILQWARIYTDETRTEKPQLKPSGRFFTFMATLIVIIKPQDYHLRKNEDKVSIWVSSVAKADSLQLHANRAMIRAFDMGPNEGILQP
jgi:hypothetical protein